MDVVVRGKIKKLTGQEVQDIVDFAVDKMISADIADQLYIEIKFKKVHQKRTGNLADCSLLHEEDQPPEDFLLNISTHKQSKYEIILNLLHELVHVKQYATGEMSDVSNNTKFRGKVYRVTNMDYYDLPWEWDAFGRSYCLMEQYMKHVDVKEEDLW